MTVPLPPLVQPPTAEAPTAISQPQTATPSVSYTPTDTNIPPSLYEKVPNLEAYKKLQDVERNIDWLIAQKGLDFQSVQVASAQPSNLKKEYGTLRVFIYNTCEHQPWQKTEGELSWTLHVEGRFIPDAENFEYEKMKMSSFLVGLSIEIVPNSDYPALQNSPQNIIEWRDEQNGASQWLFDGVNVKRAGVFNIKTKIALLTKDYTYKLALLPQMAQFTGKAEALQQELVYLIWQYVLYKDLFKKAESFSTVAAVSASSMSSMSAPEEESDLATIRSDETLKDLLGVDAFTFKDVYKLIQQHVRPRLPIVIDYEVCTTKSTTLGDVVVDIPMEMPLSMSKVEREIIDENKKVFENVAKIDETVRLLNQRILLGVVALQNANSRETFYRELSKDPVNFLKKWLELQLETLKALKSEEGYNEEDVRRAAFFKENEELLRQKVDLMLGALRL